MLGGLAKERVSRLGSNTFTNLDRTVLYNVLGIRVEKVSAQGLDGLLSELFKGDKGETTATSVHLVTHDGHIDNLTESLEVLLYVRFYTHKESKVVK